ncbi:hypothetical protein [Rhodopirellula europaea]|uniref:hypothetical protein n=1 Tax=Rhodopirellula europaea TaxID=1263866 RepID=UPI003D2975A4
MKSTSSRSGEWRIGIRHDGELLLNSNYSGVVIRNVEGDHPWAPDIYDPRILGVNNGPRITLYAEDELFPSGLGWASLVEIETQLQFEHHESPVTASHVRWHYDAKYASDFWISNQPHFPIHQMNIQSGRDRYRCYYDDDSPIPNRIVNELLENDGTVKRHVDMRIVSLDTESSIDESNFKIDRLEMDIGEQVSDSRIRRVIGFWDGEKIVETQEAAFKNAASSNAQAANTDSETNPYVVSLAIGVIALAALVAWRRFG